MRGQITNLEIILYFNIMVHRAMGAIGWAPIMLGT